MEINYTIIIWFRVLGVGKNLYAFETTEEIDALEEGFAYTWNTIYGDGIITAFSPVVNYNSVQILWHPNNVKDRGKWTEHNWGKWYIIEHT